MRWAACAAGVGLGLVPMTGSAQEPEQLEETQAVRRTLVLAQPSIGLFVPSAQLGVGVEHAVGSHVALSATVQLSASYSHSEPDFPGSTGLGSSLQMWGVGVEPGVHFYFAGRAPEGFWVGPHAELSTYHQTTTGQSFTLPEGQPVSYEFRSRTVYYGGSVRVGYTAILSPGLTLQVGAGLAATGSRSTAFSPPDLGGGLGGLGGLSNSRSWGVSPRMTAAVGWAF
ncbi:autotransporter outer membrane beta-barrel domain-containing protein [Archangium gephyra]|uniref:autotransporter outer membrane beta-barrel domain-containing protein n=1 Tax=Archangium gephyra TaxID=48 RepID=UPI0035D50635